MYKYKERDDEKPKAGGRLKKSTTQPWRPRARFPLKVTKEAWASRGISTLQLRQDKQDRDGEMNEWKVHRETHNRNNI